MEIYILIKVQNHQLLSEQGMKSNVSHRIWSMFSFKVYPLSLKITKYMTELKLKQIKIENCKLADVERILVLIQSKNEKN